ncbi:MAG: hypothetical protein HDQ87_07755 [Clostridia bacterium]|nr:hypothetical protein [Clostridia bacterium]
MRKKAWGSMLSACLMAGSLIVPPAALAAQGERIHVDAEHFPDQVMRAFAARCDENEDGVLSLAERLAVRKMDFGDEPPASLQGAGLFGNLEILRSRGNKDIDAADLGALRNLRVLDLGESRTEKLSASGLSLISVHGDADEADLTDQQPAVIGLGEEEDSFDMTDLDPDFAAGQVSSLEGGAVLDGTVLRELEPGQTITYTYTDGDLSVDCTLAIRRANAWEVKPSIASWAAGDEKPQPRGEAAHGEVKFFYGSDTQPFSPKLPSGTGSYVMRAVVVEPDDEYAGLTQDVPFLVVPAGVDPQSASEAPDLVEAVYGDTLSDLELPSGYTWADPDLSVGSVGINSFEAVYRNADGDEQTVSINVRVMPKNGDELDISPIENEYEANHIVIRDGDVTLEKGTDYMVTNSVREDEVTVTIHFMGNYTGEVVRTFTFELENAWIIPLTAPGWTYGSAERLPQAEARYGETVYSYAPVLDEEGSTGEFADTVPENAGTYVVRAVVPSTIYYTGLRAEETFVIAKADPSYDLPIGLAAYYGTQLQALALPAGFSFLNPTETVGVVGERSFDAVYTPEDTANYNTVPVQIQVTVLPKNGSNFQVDPITTEAQAQNPVVRDGDTVLVQNTDYTVSLQRNGTQLTLTINFIGNYTGQLVRTYTFTQTGGQNASGTTTTNAPRTGDSAGLGWYVTGMLGSGAVIAGCLLSLRRRSRRSAGQE